MAIYKLTTLFQFTSAVSAPTSPLHRTAGWSESWYANATSIQAVIAAATGAAAAGSGSWGFSGMWAQRAALLPIGTSIVGYRIQQVSPVGPSQAGALTWAGGSGYTADLPTSALLMRSPGIGANNIRRFMLRGIPDNQITEGEFQPSADYRTGVNLFIGSLSGWLFRARDLSQPSIRIVSISAGGVVQTETPITYAVNNMVRILRTVDAGHNLRGGRFQVSVIGPGTNTFTLNNWNYGATTGGSVRLDGVVYPTVDSANTNWSRVTTRRVGRPFNAWRGRRSKRR